MMRLLLDRACPDRTVRWSRRASASREGASRVALFGAASTSLAGVVLLLAACGSSPSTAETFDGGGGEDASLPSDAGETCEGSAPLCAQTCGGDAFVGQARCAGTRWVCDDGTLETECPSGTCWGAPLPGEVCADGYECRPWETGALDACMTAGSSGVERPVDERLCADCRGFGDGPVVHAGCECACESGVVTCERLPQPSCPVVSTSTLAGVRLEIDEVPCEIRAAELARGAVFPWTLTVEGEVMVQPRRQDGGGCGVTPNPTGLHPFARFAREGDENAVWCLCDVGLCMRTEETVTLAPGVVAGATGWDGRAWFGPSDTSNPPGEPFGPGPVTFSIRAEGTSDGERWEVESRVTFQIVP